jgi:hypothetical protein
VVAAPGRTGRSRAGRLEDRHGCPDPLPDDYVVSVLDEVVMPPP